MGVYILISILFFLLSDILVFIIAGTAFYAVSLLLDFEIAFLQKLSKSYRARNVCLDIAKLMIITICYHALCLRQLFIEKISF